MKNKKLFFVGGFLSLLVLSGCASASSEARLKRVNGMVKDRTDINRDLTEQLNETDVQKETETILKEPLTVEGAVTIAVSNNPSLKASLAGLGISRAELMQSGLLHNPVFSAKIRGSSEDDVKTNTEYEVKQDVMDLLFWPLRKKIANTEFEKAESELAKMVVDFVQEVRAQFYEWQAAENTLSLRKDFYTAQESDLELARRQKDAGNISSLVLAERKAAFLQAGIDLRSSEQETQEAKARLIFLLGLASGQGGLKSEKQLPGLATDEFTLEDLEGKALNNRLDLAIKRQEMRTLEQSLTMARWGVIPSVEGGFNTERETDGSRVQGPVFEAEVPVFDRKQADRLRLKSGIEKAQRELESLEAQAQLEVRLAYGRLMANRDVAMALMDEIPVRQQIIRETLYQYNYMLKGVYDLLRVKQDEINTRHDYILALRDYWISRSELEHAAGTALPVVFQEISPNADAAHSIPDSEHHHGGQ